MPPTMANGKICYIEIPALDIEQSANFYRTVFGWMIRKNGEGHTAFDDCFGQVNGQVSGCGGQWIGHLTGTLQVKTWYAQ